MFRITRCMFTAALAVSLASSQQLAITVSPNPAPVGALITVTGMAVAGGYDTPYGCLVASVRSGTPNGPTVKVFPCISLPMSIPVYGSGLIRTSTWDQSMTGNVPAPPGLYWLEIQRQIGTQGGPITTEWYSVTISDPANPTPALTALTTPNFGMPFGMNLDAGAGHANEPYGIALSFTTNTGIPFAGGMACLDEDALFSLSLSAPSNIFVNLSGNLDASGVTPSPAWVIIPAVAGILCVPIHAQAVVFPAAGGFILSNDLTIPIH